MRRLRPLLAAAAVLAASSPAFAQETLDVGVLKDSDISVVQKLLYPKEDALELGFAAGWMPFDPYSTTPMGSVRVAKHFSEYLGVEVDLSGGYGLESATYKELGSEAYGIRPDAYRYLGSITADVQWSPIYAKLNWQGNKVIHHDIYGLAGVGGTLEQAMMPDGTMAFAPAVSLGAGMRFFLKSGDALRFQVRDDLNLQFREKTEAVQGWFLKQNVSLTVGYSIMKRSK